MLRNLKPPKRQPYHPVHRRYSTDIVVSHGYRGKQYAVCADCAEVINSSGDGVVGTIDASYYKGQGLRQGVEREYIAMKAYCTGNGQLANSVISDDTVGTLDCMHDQKMVIIDKEEPMQKRKYILRRLTPVECARLQGFPDDWCDGANGSDSAQYKLWGNGIALPCACDVIGRIVLHVEREKKNASETEG